MVFPQQPESLLNLFLLNNLHLYNIFYVVWLEKCLYYKDNVQYYSCI